jgi:biopolymer transport protein ExbD
MSQTDQLATVPDEGTLPIRKQKFDDPYFDLTAMIDLVFMMNIFFLVTSLASSMAEVDLPPAQHAKAADMDKAIIVTILGGKPPTVYLNDSDGGALPEGKEQEQRIQAAIEAGMDAGKNILLIKAEKGVLHRDVARVANLAAAHEGLQLNLAVLEFD